jgi:hypothetical protein
MRLEGLCFSAFDITFDLVRNRLESTLFECI